jgi:hypothetical protein
VAVHKGDETLTVRNMSPADAEAAFSRLSREDDVADCPGNRLDEGITAPLTPESNLGS